jgi:uncharacterized membrane protein YphA (DoxX/SURF4 family)
MSVSPSPQIDLAPIQPPRKRLLARIVPWIAQCGVAAILAQTLFFKFTYAPETQQIFANWGGRPIATLVGILELIAAILLLVPRTAAYGASLALLIISGAIFTHLTSLGIEVNGDGGFLFGLALAVAFGSLVVLAFRWRQLPFVK